jgi:Flp pilus assembly protein TadG
VRTSFLTNWLGRFRRKTSGNVAIIFALSAPVVFFAVAIAIDYTNASVVRSKLNAAADAAALAALTPTVLQETTTQARQVATAMFNARAAALGTLVPGSAVPTVGFTPSNNPAMRIVTVSYTAQVYTLFGFINSPNGTMSVSGTSTAQASVPPNINFYLLLDNSPSMQLPSTLAGINQMVSLTPLQDGGNGCAFACHQASTNNSDTFGNPCSDGATPPNYSLPTVTYSYVDGNGATQNLPNALCPAKNALGVAVTQIDNFALSRKYGIQLRLDELSLGVTTLMQTAFNYQHSGNWSTPPVYKFAAYEMDSATAVETTLSGNTPLMGLTADFKNGWTTASGNFGVMEMWANNQYCADPPGCDSGLPGSSLSDTATNYDVALSSINNPLIMPNPGNGTNVQGDTPQEVLFFVTDGVEDEANLIRLIQPINAAGSTNYCTQIKGRGIKIAILYTEYFPVTSNGFYNGNVAPFQTQIGPALHDCASTGLYIDAQVGDNLGQDLAQLFQLVVQSAALSN